MKVVSFGGGVNSTAMLIGLWERGEKVDLILFADTGGEKPHTYAHVLEMSEWLVDNGMPPITKVIGLAPRMASDGSLEAECLRKKSLPSIAYGFKSCSLKWKIEPQKKYIRDLTDENIIMLVGYDADETHRTNRKYDDATYTYLYPLVEWNWGREECIKAIDRANITQPGKSACFFCPSSKKQEIYELRRAYPELAERAVAMERNAELTTVKGLGRNFAWGDLYAADDAQGKLFAESRIEIDCGCYDG